MSRITWLFTLGYFILPSTGHAQPATEPVEKEGIELRRNGHDAEALAVFARALAIDPTARTRAQVALAEQALGLWVEAERDLSAALSVGDDKWFVQHKGALESALDAIRTRLATLEVEANVVGAELWVNGSLMAIMPLSSPLRVVAGSITIEIRAPGFETQTRTVHVDPQTHARELVDLTKTPLPTPVRRVPVLLRADASSAQSAGSMRFADDNRAAMRTAAWASLGGAAALVAGASVAVLIHNSNAATYNDDARCFYGGLTRDQRCGGYRDAVSTAQALSVLQFGAAAAALGAAAVFFTLTPSRRTNQPATLGCAAGVGITCGASF